MRWIYDQFTRHGQSEAAIARALNEKGIPTDLGRAWASGTVHQVLTNEKYIGNNVYNRTLGKLTAKRRANDPAEWVRSDGAFTAIVSPGVFLSAQRIVEERNRQYSDAEMLERLAHLFRQHGALSGIIIDEAEGTPSASAYQSRFGSLIRAYELIGFRPERDYRYIEINRALHRETVSDTIKNLCAQPPRAQSCRVQGTCGQHSEDRPQTSHHRVGRHQRRGLSARLRPGPPRGIHRARADHDSRGHSRLHRGGTASSQRHRKRRAPASQAEGSVVGYRRHAAARLFLRNDRGQDGAHLEILKSLGEASVVCLIATDDEAFTQGASSRS